MNLSWRWPWSHHDPPPDPKAEAAEERVDALEVRADAAEESLRSYLRFRRDPWAGPVLNTIHGRHGTGGRNAR